jgi:hypothetical protein
MGQAVSPANAVARRPPFRKRCPVAGEIYDSMVALPSAWVAGSLADLLRGHILHPDRGQERLLPAAACLGLPLRGRDSLLVLHGYRFQLGLPRHCFASMLIREGADVVFVSRQLGDSSPATLSASTPICSTPRLRQRKCETHYKPASVVTPW